MLNLNVMKKILFSMLLVALFQSCQKETVNTSAPGTKIKLSNTSVSARDTISDSGSFKIKLLQDSAVVDETLLYFNHKASPAYLMSEDACYLQGFGGGSLSSISQDGVNCAIQKLPFYSGMGIRLNIETKNSDDFILQLSYQNKMPEGMGIWLKDSYKKDSINIRNGNYALHIDKTDTASFGAWRFKVILR